MVKQLFIYENKLNYFKKLIKYKISNHRQKFLSQGQIKRFTYKFVALLLEKMYKSDKRGRNQAINNFFGLNNLKRR